MPSKKKRWTAIFDSTKINALNQYSSIAAYTVKDFDNNFVRDT